MIQHFVIFEIEQKLLSNTEVASLLFIPHAARVLTFLLYGWSGTIGVLFGHIAMFEWLLGNANELSSFVRILISSLCAPTAFFIMKRAHLRVNLGSRKTIDWRHIILVGAIASVINGCLGLWLIKDELPAESVFSIIWTSMIGDTMGLLVVMLLLPSFLIKR
jgi:hypothetical protein